MKQSFFITLALIAALAIIANSQSPYDPNKDYNVTYIEWWPYNYSLLRLCQIPSPDGTYCLQCKQGATRQDNILNGKILQYGWCMFEFIPDDCYAYDRNMNCVLCHDGFWMNASLTNDRNLCKPKTYGCQVYDPNIKKCQTCMPGWTMNTTVNGASNLSEYFCYFIPDVNCVKYDANNICLGCATNYAVINNKCVFWLANCATMNGNVCSKCSTNFQLDSSGKCVAIPKISNCASQVDYTCSSCLTGYNLANNQCVSAITIPSCAQISGTVCSKCNSGYYITTDGKCAQIPAIPNCQSQIDFTCQSCATGYNLVNNACVYVIANCAQVNGLVCAKCNTNFEITVDGKCSAIAKIPNCASQVDYTCSSCTTGYALANNQCTFIINNCALVNGMVCAKCNTNFEITIDGKCAPIAKISNCASQVDYTCQSCTVGWALSNNQCTYIIDNCAIVNGMVCTKCNTDYSITVDGKCSYISRIFNCASQVDFTCSSCASGYALINNSCVYIIDNCVQVNGMICTQCNSGYAITIDGKCQLIPKVANCANQVDFTCQSCLTGFILFNNQCTAVNENCFQYTGATCSKCVTNYQLTTSNTCTLIPRISNCLNQVDAQCLECKLGYNLLNNACVYKIDNCLKAVNTVCEQCNQGFIISQGKCISDPFAGLDPNCRLYDLATYNKCLACSAGFFLNSLRKCEQVDPLCKTYSGNNGFCLSCYVGYSLDNSRGKCIKASSLTSQSTGMDYCNQYDWTRNVCVKCAEGCYFDAQGKCQKYADQYCKTPSSDLKTCSLCYQGYTFDSTQGKCVAANFNCATWSNGKCATCPKGYYLDSKYECILSDPYCYIFNHIMKTCVICYPGYVWDSERKCKPLNQISPDLAKYSQNCAKIVEGQCTECYFGYYIAKDTVGSYCVKVSDLCKSYDKLNGKCTSCYLGYYLSTQGDCLRYF